MKIENFTYKMENITPSKPFLNGSCRWGGDRAAQMLLSPQDALTSMRYDVIDRDLDLDLDFKIIMTRVKSALPS